MEDRKKIAHTARLLTLKQLKETEVVAIPSDHALC
jgi:hypothetical protein